MSARRSGEATLARAARIQTGVVSALIVRFLVTRYGRRNIGFVWAIVEPMLLCLSVMTLWSFAKPASEHGVKVVALVLTGYMPLTLWRHTCQAGVHVLRNAVGLMYHRNITMIDTVLSRMALEFVSTTAAFIVVYAVLATLGIVEPIHDHGLVLAGWFAMGALSLGAGCVLAALTEYSEVVEKFVQPVQYILVPVSGCFYMLDWLPARVRDWAEWVPMVHAYEAIRDGFFGPAIPTHHALPYAGLVALLTIALGLVLIEAVRDRVHPH